MARFHDFTCGLWVFADKLCLRGDGNSGYNTDCGIDNWNVNIVPEPASILLLAAACPLVLKRSRRVVAAVK